MNAVETSKLTKRYGDQLALAGIDMLVPEGAVYVLVGANGAGKSTTFKILLNLERPTSGIAKVFDLDTGTQGPHARAQIGYVPEKQESPFPAMTCARLIQHVAAFYPSWDWSYCNHLTQSLDIRMAKKSGSLSKGELRRLQLVLAIAHRPPLLLLDEPTEGLDPVARRQVLTLITEHLSDSPATIVIATHHVHEVDTLCDYIGVLNTGHLTQMSRDDADKKIKRYELELSDNWKAPASITGTQMRRSSRGNDAQWTIIGDEHATVERLTQSGAHVREVQPLSFEDATLALLSAETTR